MTSRLAAVDVVVLFAGKKFSGPAQNNPEQPMIGCGSILKYVQCSYTNGFKYRDQVWFYAETTN